jgi:hypothetical protein
MAQHETERTAEELFDAIVEHGSMPAVIRVKTATDRPGLATFAINVPAEHAMSYHPNAAVRALNAVRVLAGTYRQAAEAGYRPNYLDAP